MFHRITITMAILVVAANPIITHDLTVGVVKLGMVLISGGNQMKNIVLANVVAAATNRLSVNDSTILATGPSGTPLAGKVFLTKGTHTIKTRCEDGNFKVERIIIQ